jgi:multiphosphoryl transfer protein
VIGIVLVSHSAGLAEGVAELARQMGGDEVAIEPAGGLEDGSIGTDAERVRQAIERAMSDDGVLVLMDLGSALMSAEMAVEFLADSGRVELCEAPLVEGAVAAAAAARTGASLEDVRAEATRALDMKASQLGAGEPATPAADEPEAPAPEAEARIPVLNEIGLHARPAALVVELAGRFDADLRLAKPGGPGPVRAGSLTGLMTLVARKGDELVATASGPQGREALSALEDLARDGFGEGVARTAVPQAQPTPAAPPPLAGPERTPEAGDELLGIAASAGIALGPVRHLREELEPPPERPSEGADAERRRLKAAREAARAAIERDRQAVVTRGAAGEAGIFAAHLALLDDDVLLERAAAAIDAGAGAERAWYAASEETAAEWKSLDDELLQARAIDVQDVGRRVLAALEGREMHPGLAEAGILVAGELTPAAAAALDPALVRGIATAHGAPTSHAAILARAFGIPAVVGLGASVTGMAEGTPVLLDGDQGSLVVSPSDEAARSAQLKLEEAAKRRRAARERASDPARTVDGVLVEVSANLGRPGDAADAVALGADGVGLLRTEFLFLDRPALPSEDEQAETLASIAAALGGRPMVVRTLDVGADKPLPAVPMPPEQNPFLGVRGLRHSLSRPDVLATQLRAILRVAARHPLKLMFPMVATPAELDAALAAVSEARAETGVDAPLEVGIMVEVPSAALLAERLARNADFFSIGTNDLSQYTMAAERGNEHLAELLSGPQPAVLRLVHATVAGAEMHDRWVGVCGELAGDPAAAVLLVGLGVRELSMASPLVPEVKEALRSVTLTDAAAAAARALDARDAADARSLGAALL